MLPKEFRADAGLSGTSQTAAIVTATGVDGKVDADIVDGVMVRIEGSPVTFTGKTVIARQRVRPHTSIFADPALRTEILLGSGYIKLMKVKLDPVHRCLYVYKPAD